MDVEAIIVSVYYHPWVVVMLAAAFFGCNALAWMRVRREAAKDYRRPRLPLG